MPEEACFKLHSEYQPTGDQPQAIDALVKGFEEGNMFQTLLGVTGSGKTFTMANVISKINKPTLIIAHNKTLAAQLYGEFKEFFDVVVNNKPLAVTVHEGCNTIAACMAIMDSVESGKPVKPAYYR